MPFVEPGDPQELSRLGARRVRGPLRRRAGRRRPGARPGQPDRRAHRLQQRAGACRSRCRTRRTPPSRPRADDVVRIASAAATRAVGGPTRRGVGPGPSTAGRRTPPACCGRCARTAIDVAGRGRRSCDSSVPLGAGLSSSAALECAVGGRGRAALLGLRARRRPAARLVAACMRAETEVVGAPTGGMDQTVALLAKPGTALLIDFDAARRRRPVPLGLGRRRADRSW